MKIKHIPSLLPVILLIFATSMGCGVSSQRQMADAGQQPLSAQDLVNLVNDRALHLTAIDFDAQVAFREGGKLAATSRGGEKDTGSWDVTTDNMLCLDFRTWYFGDQRCYTVYAEGDAGQRYLFFTGNGARYYTGTVLSTVPEELSKVTEPSNRTSYLKSHQAATSPATTTAAVAPVSEPAAPSPQPGPEEIKRLTVSTAKNCPGCDFSGVDFSQTDLSGANLAGAKLVGADLTGTSLRRANLSGADLQRAILRTSNLAGANLEGSNLTLADFTGANLIKANLNGAATRGAIFTDALTEGATGLK